MYDDDYDYECPECGGSDGFHESDCSYDGTDEYDSYSLGSGGSPNVSGGSSAVSGGKVFLFYIIALIIGYGFNEIIGAILLLGMIFWLCVH